ncbi:MAG: nucleotidyltransferase family protein [Dehalococcoidia bacterium]
MKVGGAEFNGSSLREFCQKWGVAELSVFGSVLRDDFRPDSDIDFLVTWLPDREPRLFDMLEMKDELARLVGRSIDLAQKSVVERDHNPIRRGNILSMAKVVYAAA